MYLARSDPYAKYVFIKIRNLKDIPFHMQCIRDMCDTCIYNGIYTDVYVSRD